MKFLRSKAAALALGLTLAAGSASASIAEDEIIFGAFDRAANVAWSFDTGLSYSQLLSNPGAIGQRAFNFLSITSGSSAGWQSFLDAVAAAPSRSGIQFLVFASNVPSTSYVTTGPGSLTSAQQNPPTGANLGSAVSRIDLFRQQQNLIPTGMGGTNGTHMDMTNGWALDFNQTANTSLLRLVGTGNNYNNTSRFPAVGSTTSFNLGLYNLGLDSQFQPAAPVSFGTVSFQNGTLTVTPVPEPGTYALLLAGLFTVGLIARRRMR